jgi:hypothetical protein
MDGYLPHINTCLFVVYALVVGWNTTDSELHATDAIVQLARDFGSWTWLHWSLRRCQCVAAEPSVARVQSFGTGSVARSKTATMLEDPTFALLK